MHALLIGKRARILDDVAHRLRDANWTASLDNNLDIPHLRSINVSDISVVAFGKALSKEQKDTLASHYRQQNPSLQFVEGLAPIPELITYQILAAFHPIAGLSIQGTDITADNPMRLHIKAYRLNWLYQLRIKEADATINADEPFSLNAIAKGYRFITLTSDDSYAVIANS